MKLRHLQFTIALLFLFHSPTAEASSRQDEAPDGYRQARQTKQLCFGMRANHRAG